MDVSGGELISEAYAEDGAVWATGNCGVVVRVSTAEPTGVQRVKISGEPIDSSAVAALGSFWISDEERSEVVRIDLRTATVRARIPVLTADPDEPEFAVVAGQHSVWVVDVKLAHYVQRVGPGHRPAVADSRDQARASRHSAGVRDIRRRCGISVTQRPHGSHAIALARRASWAPEPSGYPATTGTRRHDRAIVLFGQTRAVKRSGVVVDSRRGRPSASLDGPAATAHANEWLIPAT